MHSKASPLKIKLAGGAAAQCLALMNAIYLGDKLKRDFQLFYYPHSTGTYWPFALDFLLKPSEVGSASVQIKGLDDGQHFEVGKIIRQHPLVAKKFSHEGVLSIIRRIGLERILQRLRGEDALLASQANLDHVSMRSKTVSGGFVPINVGSVNSEMNQRFLLSEKKSPFSISVSESQRPDVVIHYRIGDKRAKFSHPSDFGGDGVSDPNLFKSIIDSCNIAKSARIIVVSDEPSVAQSLLREAGIEVQTNPIKGDIWEDLFLMSQARLFIGSWSQVSQLAAICVVGNGGKAQLPSTNQVGTKIRWSINEIDYFTPKFLEEEHWIYSDTFVLDPEAHISYRDSRIESADP